MDNMQNVGVINGIGQAGERDPEGIASELVGGATGASRLAAGGAELVPGSVGGLGSFGVRVG